MEIDKLETNLKTLADAAYRHAANTGIPDLAVIAETLQNIAVGLTAAIRTLQQEVTELRRRIAPADTP